MAYHEKLVRFLIAFSVSSMNLYFKVKAAKVNGIYKRIEIATNATTTPSAPQLAMIRKRKILLENNLHSTVASYELVPESTHSKLPQLDAQMRFYDLFHHLADWYLLAKNILIRSLRHKSLAHWRFLDCFLLGRYLANGRAIELTPYCVCYESLVWLTWRYIMLRQTPEFKLPCFEFLLDKRCHEPFWARKKFMSVDDPEYHSALLEYQDPFAIYPEKHACTSTARRPPFRLRPNRTREAWQDLARATLIYYAFSSVIVMGVVGIFLSMGLPVAITRRGFSLNYRICIDWLATRKSASATQSYGHFLGGDISMFMRPQIVREFLMPLTDFVNFNFFHILRVTFEILETSFVYLEVCVGFNYGLFITVIMSQDVLCYSQSIIDRMNRLTAYMRWQRELHPWDMYHLKGGRNRVSYFDRCKDAQSTRREISDIQAQIADMFTMLDSYNKYMSLQAVCFLIFWLGYAAMVSSWIFLPGNESPKLEWYAILFAASIYLLILLNYMTQVKTSCCRLYYLISVAMALSEGGKCERDVWISLLSYYKPRPMYCFTMLNSVELTYLSGLQLVIWLFSALIIASSFFKVHNIK